MRGGNKRKAFWLAMALATAVPAGSARAAEGRTAIELPAQSLAVSLEALAASFHSQLLYSADLVKGLNGTALKGEFSAEEALGKLLQGSGLEARAAGDGNFTIARVPHAAATVLDTVTIVATRTVNRTFDVPASVSTVTREQMDDAQAKDIATVVRTIPGVNMGGSPREAGQIPSIRGYQGPDIILRVDDARRSLDTSVGIFSPLLVDPNFVKQIDVVRGPSSATYGGGGLGGVLAFQTIDAEDILTQGQSVGGRIKTAYRSGDGTHSANLTTAAQAEGASILASGTIRNYHNVETGAHVDNLQNGLNKNGLLKLGFKPNEFNAFKVAYTRFYDDGYGPTNPASNEAATTGFQQRKRSQDELNGSWAFKDGGDGLLDGKATLYYTKMKYDSQKRSTGASDQTMAVETGGGNVQNTSRFTTAFLGHRLTYGMDGYRDTLTNTSSGAANSVNPDGKMVALGGFIQDEIEVFRDWTLIATLRQDSYEADASGQSSNANNHLSPKIAVKWQALPAVGVFAGYGEAFRAPTLTELYNNLSGTGNFSNFRANGTLRPEVSRGKELGATLALKDLVTAKDALKVKGTFFDEDVKDLINSTTVGTYTRTAPYAGTGSIFQYNNVSHAHRWGAEAELTYRIEDWDLGLGYSRMRVKDVGTGSNLFSPPDKGTATLGYAIDDFWTVRYWGRFVASQDYDSTTARQRRGYSVHDIGTAYDRDWYRIDLGLSNLFNAAYASYHQSLATSYVYEEGRSFNVTLTARF